LNEIINLRHPPVRLPGEIDWDFLARRFSAVCRVGPGSRRCRVIQIGGGLAQQPIPMQPTTMRCATSCFKGNRCDDDQPRSFLLAALLRLVGGVGTAGLLVMSSEPNEEKASPIVSIKRRTRFG